MSGSNLSELLLINLELIQFSAKPGIKPISCPNDKKKELAVKTNSQEKELSYNSYTLVFERHFVAVVATLYQEPHFLVRLRTEGQELFAFRFDQIFPCLYSSQCMIQFMEFGLTQII